MATRPDYRPRLTIRVGVTGHRMLPEEAEQPLRTTVRAILSSVQELARNLHGASGSEYSAQHPVFRLVSPIAEGADRLVAQEALSLGYELQCPLPFPADEYAKDFKSEDSRQQFRELLSHAATTAVLELDGSRENEADSYFEVGQVVLDQCDLLLAIWDGKETTARGGTAEIYREAVSAEIPTIRIAPASPLAPTMVICDEGTRGCVFGPDTYDACLAGTIERLLLPDDSEEPGSRRRGKKDASDRYVRVNPGGSILGSFWDLFLRIMSWTPRRSEYVQAVPEDAPAQDAEALAYPFRRHYQRANRTAKYLAGLYRGSFLLNYMLGVLAVFCALLSALDDPRAQMWLWIELGTIALIFLVIILANTQHWHRRSIDWRYLAEQLRQMRFLHPIAAVTPWSRRPAPDASGDPRATWMNRHFRALAREIGMPTASLKNEYLDRCWEQVRRDWIGGQSKWHDGTAARLRRIYHRLHWLAWIFFGGTAAACGLHLSGCADSLEHLLTLLTAGLPACGAAAYAISSQGEFHRLAERSETMASQLAERGRELDKLRERSSFTSRDLRAVASAAAQMMIDEVIDWRILYRKPPMEPH